MPNRINEMSMTGGVWVFTIKEKKKNTELTELLGLE